VVPLCSLLGLFEHESRVPEHVPGLGLQSLGAESDAAVHLVVVNDHAFDLHARLKDLFQILNSVVRDLRNVKESRHAAHLDEGAVGLEGLDEAVDDVASGQVGHLLFDDCPAVGDNELVALLIDLEELEGKSLPDEVLGRELTGQVRAREERSESLDKADGSATVHGNHLSLEDIVLPLPSGNLFPRLAVLDAPHGNEELAVLVLLRDDLEVTLGVNVDQVLDGVALGLDESSLADRKESGGLGTNVDDAPTIVVLDDSALDDIIPVEGVVGGLDSGIEVSVGEVEPSIRNINFGPLVRLLETVKSGGLRDSGRVKGAAALSVEEKYRSGKIE